MKRLLTGLLTACFVTHSFAFDSDVYCAIRSQLIIFGIWGKDVPNQKLVRATMNRRTRFIKRELGYNFDANKIWQEVKVGKYSSYSYTDYSSMENNINKFYKECLAEFRPPQENKPNSQNPSTSEDWTEIGRLNDGTAIFYIDKKSFNPQKHSGTFKTEYISGEDKGNYAIAEYWCSFCEKPWLRVLTEETYNVYAQNGRWLAKVEGRVYNPIPKKSFLEINANILCGYSEIPN